MCDSISCGKKPGRAGRSPELPSARRRAFLRGMATLPLAAVLADPMLARAAGEGLEAVSLTTASGKTAHAFLGVPGRSPAPAVLLIHEWWGLNDQIKAVTAELAQQGFLALAVDLYDGKVATTAEDANAYRTAVDATAATEALVAWVAYLRAHPGGNGKVGTVGWCFGGGWSLNASLATPVDATVVYYGSVAKTAEELAPLAGPVLGHFGTLDERINAEMVAKFEEAMKAAGKPDLSVHWYEADHAFANPSGARYDEEDAQLAWTRTLEFLTRHLG
jgi:carboxymethylenebutenolidase